MVNFLYFNVFEHIINLYSKDAICINNILSLIINITNNSSIDIESIIICSIIILERYILKTKSMKTTNYNIYIAVFIAAQLIIEDIIYIENMVSFCYIKNFNYNDYINFLVTLDYKLHINEKEYLIYKDSIMNF